MGEREYFYHPKFGIEYRNYFKWEQLLGLHSEPELYIAICVGAVLNKGFADIPIDHHPFVVKQQGSDNHRGEFDSLEAATQSFPKALPWSTSSSCSSCHRVFIEQFEALKKQNE